MEDSKYFENNSINQLYSLENLIIRKASLSKSFLTKSGLAEDCFPHPSTHNPYLSRSSEFNPCKPLPCTDTSSLPPQSPFFGVFPHTEHLQLSLHLIINEVVTYTQSPLTSLGCFLSNPREFTRTILIAFRPCLNALRIT